jgi:hypothetical protein
MRQPPQLEENPRRLQLNATSIDFSGLYYLFSLGFQY